MPKRILTMVLCVTLLMTNLVKAAESTDPSKYKGASSWAIAELDRAADYGLITDRIKDKMNSNITREEFCEVVVKLYETMTGKTASYKSTNTFSDTRNPEIYKAYELGIAGGVGNGKFAPNDLTNREQLAAMLYRAIKIIKPDADFSTGGVGTFPDQKSISQWALEPMKFMNKNGIIKGGGDGRINPKGTATREQAVIMTVRLYEKFSIQYDLEYLVINDYDLSSDRCILDEKGGIPYVFISSEDLKYAFKMPYMQYTYPEVTVDGKNISIYWMDNNEITLKIDMVVGETEALVNGVEVDAGRAPFEKEGKVFIPINLLVTLFEMKIEVDEKYKSLLIQYNEDFPAEALVGTWSDVHTDLFVGVKDLVTGLVTLPSFATAYRFESDGTYSLRMVAAGGMIDKFIDQKGKYRVIGNTIMFYDIIETLYEGDPFTLVYKDKALEKPHYDFICDYNSKEDKISLGMSWLSKNSN